MIIFVKKKTKFLPWKMLLNFFKKNNGYSCIQDVMKIFYYFLLGTPHDMFSHQTKHFWKWCKSFFFFLNQMKPTWTQRVHLFWTRLFFFKDFSFSWPTYQSNIKYSFCRIFLEWSYRTCLFCLKRQGLSSQGSRH